MTFSIQLLRHRCFYFLIFFSRYEKAIKTIEDLASSNLPWGAPTDAWLISLRQVEEV